MLDIWNEAFIDIYDRNERIGLHLLFLILNYTFQLITQTRTKFERQLDPYGSDWSKAYLIIGS